MELQQLSLVHFRSYEQAAADFGPQINILYGDNGQGKTNLLESIFLLTGARSWRAARKAEMISFQQQQAKIEARIRSRGREFKVEMQFSASGHGKSLVNGVKTRRQGDLSEVLRCVLFSPEDLSLIREGAAARRGFLDQAICQLRPRYAELLAQYGRLLEHKAKLLKNEEKREQMLSVLPVLNQRLVELGAPILQYRARFIRLLAPHCTEIHSQISGKQERLELDYQTVSTVEDPFAPLDRLMGWLQEHLDRHGRAELDSRSCLSGIHKDDLLLSIDGHPAKSYASQGQTRTAVLALKFGERALFFEDSGEYPVLLLDDVLSELDANRQEFVKSHTLGGQTILTCCDGETQFSSLNGRLFHVKKGSVTREK